MQDLDSPRPSLSNWSPWRINSYAIFAAFWAYFCMYAFRKPFAAATYAGASPLSDEMSFKTSLVIAQIIGYALSKYWGTRILPALPATKRALTIVQLVGMSWGALLLFANVPKSLQLLALFTNGLCLGMIWGLVVGFLEGRRASELLLAGLSCSFIVASGAVKDVGRALLSFGLSEDWMPFCTGGLFVPGLLLSVWMLQRLPPPTELDEAERSRRTPMGRQARWAFLQNYLGGLLTLLVPYFFLTAYRDYRDNYGIEIFTELGYTDRSALFSSAEIPVAVGVLLVLSLLSLVRNNHRALLYLFATMVSGLLLLSGATWLLRTGTISGMTWMILVGIGSYLAYVPFGSVIFDRIMAKTRAPGTAIFGIYLADSLGYTGSVGVQIYADLFAGSLSRLEFFFKLTHLMAWGGAALLCLSATLWLRPTSRHKPDTSNESSLEH